MSTATLEREAFSPRTAASSLVMTKRRLPRILRNDVPPLCVASAESLIATRRNMWSVILHHGRPALVVNTHEHLRQIVDADGARFWVGRRATNKREMRKKRIARQFASGIRNVFRPPHWVPDARPAGARRVEIRSQFPTVNELHRLVFNLSYEGSAAFSSLVRGHRPWEFIGDRRHKKAVSYNHEKDWRDWREDDHAVSDFETFQPIHPYVPTSPGRRTQTGGGYRKEQVTAAIQQHNWDDAHSVAVYEVVHLRRSPSLVAAARGLKVRTVYEYASRVRSELRSPKKAD